MPVAPLRNANREPHWVMAYSVKTTNLHDHFPPVLRAASTADQDVRADVPEHKESPLQSLNPSPLSTMLLRSLFHANCRFFFLIFLFLFLCIIADFVEGSGESVVSGGYRAGLYRLNLITCYFANRDGVRERHVYTTDSGAVILSRKPFIFTFSPSILRSHIEKTVKG